MTIMAKKKKKKGRPSLLDLQKRSLKQQQQQQLLLQRRNPSFCDFSPNPIGRSNLRYGGLEATTGLIAGDDDDERKEKKHKLVVGLDSNSDAATRTALSFNSSAALGSDSNADGEDDDDGDPDVSRKRRKISAVVHGSNHMSEKVLKATDNSVVHGLQVESGPTTTPLPDKKLLVFILDRLQKKDTYGVFSEPVDAEELPDYHEIIENPMDFGTVRKKLDCGAYNSLEQFETDVLLICSNAMEYNAPDTIYFRQARSMQELAKKDFKNLREDSDDDSEPPPLPPKVVRRGRPPGKKVKKLTESSPFECVGPQSLSDATVPLAGENAVGSNTYNLRKGQSHSKFRPVDAVNGTFHVSLGSDTCPSLVSDWENEFPASVVRSVLKYGKKQFAVDENKRDTYRVSLSSGDKPSALAFLEGEQKQLVEVGDAYLGNSYARSLVRFAEDLGPVVWKIALKKIESILPHDIKFCPGWTLENEALQNEELLFCAQKVLPNPAADDLASRLLSQSASVSNSIRGLNNQSELASFNSNIGGIRPFQIHQNSILQPCIKVENSELLSNIPPQRGRLQTATLIGKPTLGEALVTTQTHGIVPNESNLLVNASRLDSGNFLPQGSALGSHRAPEIGAVSDTSVQRWTMQHNQQDSQPFPSDLDGGFWMPGSPTSVVQIDSPRQPDLALQLRMGW